MMRTIPFPHGGRTYHLFLNYAALFDIYDNFGSDGYLTDLIKENDGQSFDAVCWLLAKLSEQGELFRRWQGYDRGTIPTKEQFLAELSPADRPLAKRAILSAFEVGFSREEEPERKAIDRGLLELEQKNGTRLTRSQYLNAAVQFLHLSVKEALLLPLGQVQDLIYLELKRRGLDRKET